MKKTILIVVVIAAIVVASYFVWKNYKKGETTTTTGGGTVPLPDVVKPTDVTPLFADSGNGLIAVTTRMKQLADAGQYTVEAGNLSGNVLFAGNVGGSFAATMGGVSLIPWPLTAKMKSALNDAANIQPTDNVKTQMQGLQRANLNFIEAGLPAFLPEEAKGGGEKNFFKGFVCKWYSGCPSNFDLHKVKFLPQGRQMYSDLNMVAKNILAVNTQLEQKVRERAIADLIAAGYKFVGYV